MPVRRNGRIILPAALLRAMCVAKGDRVLMQADGDRIGITTMECPPEPAPGCGIFMPAGRVRSKN